MRSINFYNGGFYHIYNRGNNKQQIYFDEHDYFRMYLVMHVLNDKSRAGKRGIRASELDYKKSKNNFVDIIGYCFMPNHYHLLVRQRCEKGVSKFMHRLGDSYTKYFNSRYSHSGHAFTGPYKIRAIEKTSYLLHASRYIHTNPAELFTQNCWSNITQYKFSSLSSYLTDKPDPFLATQPILSRFKSKLEYRNYVREYFIGKYANTECWTDFET